MSREIRMEVHAMLQQLRELFDNLTKLKNHLDTLGKEQMEPMRPYLKAECCQCEEDEFLCYPENGACTCGVFKHHVHCKKCGGISQVG